MTLALLFPGQGVQHPAMLPWLEDESAAQPMLVALGMRLGVDWRAKCADEAWITRNAVAQPLIVGLSLAVWAALRSRIPGPLLVAGYSVGELAAYSAAQVFDPATALDLAAARAEAMDHAGANHPGGLCAVAGLATAQVEALIAAHGLTIALRNAIDRCVIGGPREKLEAAAAQLLSRGADLTPLRIGVASHTPAMASAAATFGRLLRTVDFERADTLVVTGTDGHGSRDPAILKAALAAQIDTPVEWARTLQTIAERQPHAVLEVGPGCSLARMWTAAFPAIPARSVDEFRNLAAAIAWVEGRQRR